LTRYFLADGNGFHYSGRLFIIFGLYCVVVLIAKLYAIVLARLFSVMADFGAD